MKRIHLLAGVAALALLSSPLLPQAENWIVAAAQAQSASVSVGVFYDELASEGTWVKHSRYRYVWTPTKVAADWTPYTNGHWIYTERYGWYFASEEPFAWAVYHYGRWAFEPQLGWYWVPGRVWAPAWVSWRRSNDHVGWAPLPPEGDGLSVSVSISTYEPPRSHWHFVPVRQFASRDLSVVIVNESSVYERTEYYGPVTIENNVVINNVINIDFVRENSDEEVEVVEAKTVDDPRDARQADGGAVVVVDGEVGEPSSSEAPPQAQEPTEVKSPTAEQEVEATAEAGTTDAPASDAEAPADASDNAADNPEAEQTQQDPAVTTDSDASSEATEAAEEPVEGEADAPAGAADGSRPADQPAEGATSGPADGNEPAGQPAAEGEAAQPAEQPAPEAETAQPDQPADSDPAATAPDTGEAAGEAPAATAPAEQPAEQVPNAGEAAEQAPAEAPAQPGAAASEEQQPARQQCSAEDKAAGRC